MKLRHIDCSVCGYKHYGILVAIMVTSSDNNVAEVHYFDCLWQSCVCAAFGYLQQPIVASAISSGSFGTVNAGLLASQCMLLLAYFVFKRQYALAL